MSTIQSCTVLPRVGGILPALRSFHGQQQVARLRTGISHIKYADHPPRLKRPSSFRWKSRQNNQNEATIDEDTTTTTITDRFSARGSKTVMARVSTPTTILEEELAYCAHNVPHPGAIQKILKILIEDRGVKPTSIHYEALILGNCHPQHGSVDDVRSILQEMERENITMNANIYFAVIKVLAVHPDYVLRNTMLAEMHRQWIQPSQEVKEYIIAGLMREGQLEKAVEEVRLMEQAHKRCPTWLYLLLMHALCENWDKDAIMGLIHKLDDKVVTLPPSTWLHLLERAVVNDTHEIVTWVWQEKVALMTALPAEALCLDVLHLAVRKDDIHLAESAFTVMEYLYPKLSKAHLNTLELMYSKSGAQRNSTRSQRGNLYPLFNKEERFKNAYFNPELILSQRSKR